MYVYASSVQSSACLHLYTSRTVHFLATMISYMNAYCSVPVAITYVSMKYMCLTNANLRRRHAHVRIK